MTPVTPEQLTRFFTAIGQRYPYSAKLYLFGGSALLLIGGQRNTADVDFMLDAADESALREVIAVAASLKPTSSTHTASLS